MPLKSFISQFILALSIIIWNAAAVASSEPSFSSIAACAIIIDYKTNNILFEKNSDVKMAPSSMSKLMTLYLTFKHLNAGKIKLTDEFTISEYAWKMGGSRMFVELYRPVSIENLIRGVAVHSGNDASVALAEIIAGSESLFVQQMNHEAAQLGLTQSNFENATGWPSPNHRMSCRDIAMLSSAIIRDFPEYYHYFAEKFFTYNNITQDNRNVLLGQDGVDGLKTGFTEEGGYGIAISAVKNERRMIVVVNGLASTADRISEAARLLNYGFNGFQSHALFKAGQKIQEIPVIDGISMSLELFADSDIDVITPITTKKEDISVAVLYEGDIVAPVARGQKIGDLVIKSQNAVLRKIDLLAPIDIERAPWFQRWWRQLLSYF